MTNTIEGMHDVLNIADHAAQQNDRWLMLALLGVMLIGAVFFWRWIISDREKVNLRLTAITDRYIELGEKMSEVVANNTAALTEFRKSTERCRRFNE